MTMLPLNEYAHRAHKMAREKGWHETHRSFAGLTQLMKSEHAEALEDYRDHHAFNETYFEVKTAAWTTTISEADYNARTDAGKVSECKPCGIPTELADFIIRIADFAGYAGIDLEDAVRRMPPIGEDTYPVEDFESALAVSSYHISEAFDWNLRFGMNFADLGHDDVEDFWYGIPISLAEAIRPIERFCAAHDVDLRAAIELKLAYNATRPQRHGGKLI